MKTQYPKAIGICEECSDKLDQKYETEAGLFVYCRHNYAAGFILKDNAGELGNQWIITTNCSEEQWKRDVKMFNTVITPQTAGTA